VTDSEPGADTTARRGLKIALWAAAGLLVAGALAVGTAVVLLQASESRPLPEFESLADRPDPSLRGTVAYFASDSRCVRIVAAAGSPSKDVWCLPDEGPDVWAGAGKPAGPQLVWRPDGRLEITMFRWDPNDAATKTDAPPPLVPGWQKVVDVRTGTVEDVPASDLPSEPNLSTQPTVNAAGDVVDWELDAASGRATVELTTQTGTRTLLSVRGPGKYGYRFGPVFWEPSGAWLAATDDSRILVITPTDPARTRVLVTGAGGGAGGGTAGPEFAVTDADGFAPAP